MTLGPYREGYCRNKEDHEAHMHQCNFGIFWCHADQSRRLPYAAEMRLKARKLNEAQAKLGA